MGILPFIPRSYVNEKGYLNLLSDIMQHGHTIKDERTGKGTTQLVHPQMHFDVGEDCFPLLTTKEVPFDKVLGELLWFISGSTSIRPLVIQGINIWNDWPLKHYNQVMVDKYNGEDQLDKKAFAERIKNDEEFAAVWGELGPVYGKQWRSWIGPKHISSTQDPIDQLQNSITLLQEEPFSRRIVVSAWNPADIEEMAVSGLPPCHMSYQFLVNEVNGKKELNLHMYQRSADMFLGIPWNIASYATLLIMVAKLVDMQPALLTITIGSAHVYSDHTVQVQTQLQRSPKDFPKLEVGTVNSIDDYSKEHFELKDYEHGEFISAPIAI